MTRSNWRFLFFANAIVMLTGFLSVIWYLLQPTNWSYVLFYGLLTLLFAAASAYAMRKWRSSVG
jgi:hypothetical protein